VDGSAGHAVLDPRSQQMAVRAVKERQ
jgi:hypothetical protein